MRIVKFYFTGTDTTKTVDLFADVLAQDLGVGELVDYNYSRPRCVRQGLVLKRRILSYPVCRPLPDGYRIFCCLI